MALIDGLVHLWELEESSGTRRDSRGVVDLNTVGGSPARVDGIVGFGVDLDGSSDYLLRSNVTYGFDGVDDATIAFWLNADQLGSGEQKTVFVRSGAASLIFQVRLDNATTRAVMNWLDSASTTRTVATGNILSTDTWYHFVCRYRRNDAVYMDINDGAVFSDSVANADLPMFDAVDGTMTITLGVNPSGLGSKLNGSLDQVAIWHRALSDVEVTELYNGGAGVALNPPGLATGLIHLWELEEASGTRFDTKGNLDLDTEVGTPTNALGVIGSALSLDGTTEKVYEAGTPHDFSGIDSISLSAWINLDNPGSGQDGIVCIRTNALANIFMRALNTSGAANIIVRDDADTLWQISSIALSASTWYHLVIVYHRNGMLTLFINGGNATPLKLADLPYKNDTTTPETIIGGETTTSGGLEGLIDQVAIWNRALWSSEVRQLNNSGAGLRLSGLSAPTMPAGWLRR